jgi:hypothetical protein
MKTTLIGIIFLATMNLAFASNKVEEIEVSNLKKLYIEKSFELKVQKEKNQILQENKTDFNYYKFDSSVLSKSNFSFNESNTFCAEWVYQGPGTREQALEACRGVSNMECVEWFYLGPGTRMDAARACRRIQSFECAEWVYQGPGSKMDAIEACRGVSSMECVEWAYQGPGSRVDAARSCAHDRRRPPRDNDNCK